MEEKTGSDKRQTRDEDTVGETDYYYKEQDAIITDTRAHTSSHTLTHAHTHTHTRMNTHTHFTVSRRLTLSTLSLAPPPQRCASRALGRSLRS